MKCILILLVLYMLFKYKFLFFIHLIILNILKESLEKLCANVYIYFHMIHTGNIDINVQLKALSFLLYPLPIELNRKIRIPSTI